MLALHRAPRQCCGLQSAVTSRLSGRCSAPAQQPGRSVSTHRPVGVAYEMTWPSHSSAWCDNVPQLPELVSARNGKGDTALALLMARGLVDAAARLAAEFRAPIADCSRDRKAARQARLKILLKQREQARNQQQNASAASGAAGSLLAGGSAGNAPGVNGAGAASKATASKGSTDVTAPAAPPAVSAALPETSATLPTVAPALDDDASDDDDDDTDDESSPTNGSADGGEYDASRLEQAAEARQIVVVAVLSILLACSPRVIQSRTSALLHRISRPD